MIRESRPVRPDSGILRNARRPSEEQLQTADSVDRVLEIVRLALDGMPGVGRGALFLTGPGGDMSLKVLIHGPEAADRTAPGLEFTGMARRAIRERRPVQQRGAGDGLLWAVPLDSPDGVQGAVAAVGENPEAVRLLAHAGMALARERARESRRRNGRGAENRLEALETALGALDAIVREGRSETVLRRIVGSFAALPGIGRVTFWALRAEDGRYVEVARSDRGSARGFPEPPVEARRAEGLRDWWSGLPRHAGFSWIPRRTPGKRPTNGDTLFIPLPGHDAPHLLGFVLAEMKAAAPDPEMVDAVQRWSALGRLALESGQDGHASLARLEELREERRQVADLHHMKSQFIATVSHELRTPLTSISAYAEALRNAPAAEQEETRDRFLRVIHDESRRLARIVDDILDLATMDAGRVRLSCRAIELRDVVADALDVLHPIARDRGIRVVPPPGNADLQADPDLMKQLVVNLVENAVKFSPDGGEVRVDLEREPSAVRIIVSDDGPGIPAEELDAIFDRFYQVDGTSTREHGGSGLGLAICRSIATWHDGRIWAESEPGRGARFVVSLPRIRAVSRLRTETPPDGTPPPEETRVPELIIEMISEVIRAEAVSLMLLDESEHELMIQAAMGVPDDAIRDARVALGERISGRVAETGRSLLIPDVQNDDRFPTGPPDQYRTRSLLSVPVLLRGRTIGVINVTNKMTGASFTEEDRKLVEMLAQRVALVLQKLREHGDRRSAILRLEDAMRGVIDARRHGGTREEHGQLVREVCREMGVDDDEATRIHYASMVRDVGMTRLPESVYRKPGALTPADVEAIRRHPEESARTLRPIEFQADVFDLILSHHEKGDGSGYPRGLAGDGIPRGARILAVVDAYDALRTGRPYKRAVDAAAAVEELRAHAGTQFDVGVVHALECVLVNRGELHEGPNGRTEPEARERP